jgi:hypothetical protein
VLEDDNARLARANEASKDREEALSGHKAALEQELRQNKEQRDEAVRLQVMLKGKLDALQSQLAACVGRRGGANRRPPPLTRGAPPPPNAARTRSTARPPPPARTHTPPAPAGRSSAPATRR